MKFIILYVFAAGVFNPNYTYKHYHENFPTEYHKVEKITEIRKQYIYKYKSVYDETKFEEYVCEVVVDGFIKTVQGSCYDLIDEINGKLK